MSLIEVDGLTKSFRRPVRKTGPLGAVRTLFSRQYETVTAVEDVSFTVEAGELVGYLGPNGAGKSTTIKMLTGVLVPSGGTVTVDGLVPWRDRERNARAIGAVFGQRSQLWWDLPLSESLELIGALYDVPRAEFTLALAQMRELLDLDSFLATPVRQLSLGQRMRGDLAASMIYRPRLLYLDEPTVGLDVLAKEAVREFIAEVNAAGDTTVVLTTHDLADVERLCKRIILIDHGRVVFDGPIGDLVNTYAPDPTVVVQIDGTTGADTLTVGRHTAVRTEDGGYRFPIRDSSGGKGSLHDLLAELTAAHSIRDLSVVEPDLESVIKRIYAESGR